MYQGLILVNCTITDRFPISSHTINLCNRCQMSLKLSNNLEKYQKISVMIFIKLAISKSYNFCPPLQCPTVLLQTDTTIM